MGTGGEENTQKRRRRKGKKEIENGRNLGGIKETLGKNRKNAYLLMLDSKLSLVSLTNKLNP